MACVRWLGSTGPTVPTTPGNGQEVQRVLLRAHLLGGLGHWIRMASPTVWSKMGRTRPNPRGRRLPTGGSSKIQITLLIWGTSKFLNIRRTGIIIYSTLQHLPPPSRLNAPVEGPRRIHSTPFQNQFQVQVPRSGPTKDAQALAVPASFPVNPCYLSSISLPSFPILPSLPIHNIPLQNEPHAGAWPGRTPQTCHALTNPARARGYLTVGVSRQLQPRVIRSFPPPSNIPPHPRHVDSSSDLPPPLEHRSRNSCSNTGTLERREDEYDSLETAITRQDDGSTSLPTPITTSGLVRSSSAANNF